MEFLGVESMVKKLFVFVIVVIVLVGCLGSDDVELDKNSWGSIIILGDEFIVGVMFIVMVSDFDGIIEDILKYVWFIGVIGLIYIIIEVDEGMVIFVFVNYIDEVGFIEGVGVLILMVNFMLNVIVNVVKGLVSGVSCDIFVVDDIGVVIMLV